MTIGINIVYTGKHGVVTDLGEDVKLLGWSEPTQPTATVELVIPRYGVWEFDSREGRYRVTHTMRSLDRAKRYADHCDENEDWERELRILEHGGEWCYSCNKQDYEQNMIWHNEHLYCSDCAPPEPAKFEDIAKALQAIHPEAQVVNTGGGIDCIRVLVGHHALYFGTGGENWGASIYTVLPTGNEVWVEGSDYDPNITMDMSSDVPDAAKVAAAINAATDAFYSKHYVAHKPAGERLAINRDIPPSPLIKEYELQKKKNKK